MDTSFFLFLQKSPMNMLLFGVALATGAMLLWPLVSRLMPAGATQIDSDEAVRLINRRDALILDVRPEADFAAGHILNARHIPVADLEARMREIEKFKSRPVIVTFPTGTRPAVVCDTLKKHGFSEVFPLRGGLRSWQDASLPVQKRT